MSPGSTSDVLAADSHVAIDVKASAIAPAQIADQDGAVKARRTLDCLGCTVPCNAKRQPRHSTWEPTSPNPRSGKRFLGGRTRLATALIVNHIDFVAGSRDAGGLRWGVESICDQLTPKPSDLVGRSFRPLAPDRLWFTDFERHEAFLDQADRSRLASNVRTLGRVGLAFGPQCFDIGRWR